MKKYCRCKFEPRGYRGVEGFMLNSIYEYTYDEKHKFPFKVSIFDEDAKSHPVQKQFCNPDQFYYMSKGLFNKIFKDSIEEIDIEKDY